MNYINWKEGARFRVPDYAVVSLRQSRRADQHPQTTHFFPVIRVRSGHYDFEVLNTVCGHSLDQREVAKHVIFVPSNVKAGDELEIEWAEKHSACARRVGSDTP